MRLRQLGLSIYRRLSANWRHRFNLRADNRGWRQPCLFLDTRVAQTRHSGALSWYFRL